MEYSSGSQQETDVTLSGVIKENLTTRLFLKVMGRVEEPPELRGHWN